MTTQNNNHDRRWNYSILSVIISIIVVLFLIGCIIGFSIYLYKTS